MKGGNTVRHIAALSLFDEKYNIYSSSCKRKNVKRTDFPFTHSVARELDAIAEPHPNVLNLASTIFPSSSTIIWKKGKN